MRRLKVAVCSAAVLLFAGCSALDRFRTPEELRARLLPLEGLDVIYEVNNSVGHKGPSAPPLDFKPKLDEVQADLQSSLPLVLPSSFKVFGIDASVRNTGYRTDDTTATSRPDVLSIKLAATSSERTGPLAVVYEYRVDHFFPGSKSPIVIAKGNFRAGGEWSYYLQIRPEAKLNECYTDAFVARLLRTLGKDGVITFAATAAVETAPFWEGDDMTTCFAREFLSHQR